MHHITVHFILKQLRREGLEAAVATNRAFDVSVIHPAAYSYFRNASEQATRRLLKGRQKIIRKYAELNAINPAPIKYQFNPLVVESFGSWSEAA
jgi:hypothetical protein